MSETRRPKMAITMGDPAGIGPEIVLKTMKSDMIYGVCDPFVIGSKDSLLRAAEIQGETPQFHMITEPEEALGEYGVIDLMETGVAPDAKIEFGKVQKDAALRAYSYLERSIELGMQGRIDAVSTAPINKAALKLAGVPYIGHTEIYQELTHSPYALTMFNVHKLRVFFVSRHVSLRQACDLANHDRILMFLKNIDHELKELGFEEPTIGVAALNPHVGEGGMFGTEEIEHIRPAVEDAQKLGIRAEGPLSADAIFAFNLDGHNDCILSMYHDQGHIACKTLDFQNAVTLTLGLPFMRSSVDHGTAFDIAGKGIAQGESMIESTRVASVYAQMKLDHSDAE
ncbi:4-hydroxythreonine-4-phosphate dehydrogenase PdxA [Propionibacterium freudenreichii]|nr:4-hydroxythreonine-4-phosphate dehydrogenase PdxA [Propionibacterium freudenreichii]MDK9643913.1 4-hydroxythreonine-4-phosphate dehydrogenase PdxA [Propionibacterium freudenreichii]WFF35015.1 4-hydroxythreonine-4-phosphate dehydrogenase PdxA [Propionibacterium freudenreichii]WFF37243.1 4-hydroxythreonine-4-phosphate dehydrogenase PdxA [Propionibacterium freudenreichii]CEG87276.1 4-hydroxythreonine-4-phosphate dehydrogenase [Propionibacterium freudenreichii]